MGSSKTCFKCLREKDLSEFYRHPGMGDGHLNKCITCTKVDVANHRSKNLERIRAYDRSRSWRCKTKEWTERSRRFRENNPEKYAAHVAVSNAIRSGRLNRLPCVVCGRRDSHGHHPDYSKPLDVVWLCPIHHAEEKRREDAAK